MTTQYEQGIRASLLGSGIPDYMQEAVAEYVVHGRPTGSFLEAVISNDLKESIARADDTNSYVIRNYVKWFHNHAPSGCWGSPQKYKEWINEHQKKRMLQAGESSVHGESGHSG